jgi:hypothetical protein
MSIDLPTGLLLPEHHLEAHDAEMSFINRLGMSNLSSLHLVIKDETYDHEDPDSVFGGWASYWAKEEVWKRIANGQDAVLIDTLTSQLEHSRCESRCQALLFGSDILNNLDENHVKDDEEE